MKSLSLLNWEKKQEKYSCENNSRGDSGEANIKLIPCYTAFHKIPVPLARENSLERRKKRKCERRKENSTRGSGEAIIN